ncbi:MAG: hypothetical protein ACTSU5_01575 [Promethearchaeota archaeon]
MNWKRNKSQHPEKREKIFRAAGIIFGFFELAVYMTCAWVTGYRSLSLHGRVPFTAAIFGVWLPVYLSAQSILFILSFFFPSVPGTGAAFYITIALVLIFPFTPLSWMLIVLITGNLFFTAADLKDLVSKWRKSGIKFGFGGFTPLSLIVCLIILVLILQVLAVIPTSGSVLRFDPTTDLDNEITQNGSNESGSVRPAISFFVEWYFTEDDINWMFQENVANILKDTGSSVYLLIPESNLTGGSFALNVTRMLNARNITVWAWAALNESRGYYFTDETASSYIELIKSLIGWINEYGLNFRGIMLDIEPNTFHRERNTDFLFGNLHDRQLHALSTEVQKKLIEMVHGAGLQIAYCGPDLYIDDEADGDDDLIGIFGLPAPATGYDRYIIMTYRSLYPWTEKLPNNYFLYSSAVNFRKMFGSRLSLALATLGRGSYSRESIYSEDINGIDLLINDIRLTASLGIEEIPLWCLEWLLWYDWDNYADNLQLILNATASSYSVPVVSVNPMYFEFRSVLWFVDFMANFGTCR